MKKQADKVTKVINDTNATTATETAVKDAPAVKEVTNSCVAEFIIETKVDDKVAKVINSLRDCTSYHIARVEFLGGNRLKIYLAFGSIVCKGKIVAPDDALGFAGLFMNESEFKAGKATLNN